MKRTNLQYTNACGLSYHQCTYVFSVLQLNFQNYQASCIYMRELLLSYSMLYIFICTLLSSSLIFLKLLQVYVLLVRASLHTIAIYFPAQSRRLAGNRNTSDSPPASCGRERICVCYIFEKVHHEKVGKFLYLPGLVWQQETAVGQLHAFHNRNFALYLRWLLVYMLSSHTGPIQDRH